MKVRAKVLPTTGVQLYCGSCPHVTYLTVDVQTSTHECSVCGAVFIDEQREKRYWRMSK